MNKVSLGYCAVFLSHTIAATLYMLLLCFTEVPCLGASVSIVSILYRHKKQMQYLHSAATPLGLPQGQHT